MFAEKVVQLYQLVKNLKDSLLVNLIFSSQVHGSMNKNSVIQHFQVLKKHAIAVDNERTMLTPALLEQISFTIYPSTKLANHSLLFELFLQSKLLNIDSEDVDAYFTSLGFEFYEWAIRTFAFVSQKRNNQLFFITLIKKFKGYVFQLAIPLTQ